MNATLDDLRALVERYVSVPPEQWVEFVARLEERKLPKHRHLLRVGQVSGELAFITRGLIRRYSITAGKEMNTAFLCEGSFVSAFTSFVEQRPSEVAIETLEETHLFFLPYTAMRALAEGHPCWHRFALGAAAAKLRRENQREADLLALPAEERYDALVRAWPAVELRVPQWHIASYLGVAPETLSRIRSRRAERAQRADRT